MAPDRQPIALLREAVQRVELGSHILDVFGESGTTAVAAALEVRIAIDVEEDCTCFEMAPTRIEDACQG